MTSAQYTSVCYLVSRSVVRSVRQPVSLFVGQLDSHSIVVTESVRQSVIRLVSQSDSQSFGWWVSQTVSQSVGRSVRQSFRWWVRRVSRIVGWLPFAAVDCKFQLILKNMYTNMILLLTLPQLQKDHFQNY